MRTILSLAALVTAFHPTSDACGWMPPSVEIHRVTHHMNSYGRSFVVLGAAAGIDESRWHRISPETYDYTSFAELAPEAARAFTLVGPDGTRVVTATHRVALKDGWQLGSDGAHVALEVPDGTFEVALAGKVADAKWHALEYGYTTTEHTDIGLDVTNTQNGFQISTRGKIVTSGAGSVRGFVDAGRDRFIVVQQANRELQTIYLGNSV